MPGREARTAELLADGYPAYTTSVGWLGYDDAKVRRLAREALADGWTRFKMKVGADVEDDVRRAAILREELGPDRMLAVDANQRWDVGSAIAWMDRLRPFDPYWIEEPTSPDDVLGHAAIARAVAPIRVATGEHVQNRIMFKQFLAAGAMDVCQIDACRLGGVNEVVAVLLLAARFGVPVCPHAGGVGLCELVQHLAAFDYIAVSGSLDGRMVEYVDHLHEHFLDPVVIRRGSYVLPSLARVLGARSAPRRWPGSATRTARNGRERAASRRARSAVAGVPRQLDVALAAQRPAVAGRRHDLGALPVHDAGRRPRVELLLGDGRPEVDLEALARQRDPPARRVGGARRRAGPVVRHVDGERRRRRGAGRVRRRRRASRTPADTSRRPPGPATA